MGLKLLQKRSWPPAAFETFFKSIWWNMTFTPRNIQNNHQFQLRKMLVMVREQRIVGEISPDQYYTHLLSFLKLTSFTEAWDQFYVRVDNALYRNSIWCYLFLRVRIYHNVVVLVIRTWKNLSEDHIQLLWGSSSDINTSHYGWETTKAAPVITLMSTYSLFPIW